MQSLVFVFTALAVSSQATLLLDRNLAYRSPFTDHPEVRKDMTLSGQCYETPAQHGLDTKSIHARHVQYSKRQIIDATPFKDEHYPKFYGSDFSNVCVLPLIVYTGSEANTNDDRVLLFGMVV